MTKALLIACFAASMLYASAPPGRYIYQFDGPPSVRALRVSGAAAEWTRTTEDGAEIEGIAEKLPPVKAGAAHLVLEPGRSYTTVDFAAASGLASDWSGYEKLVLYFESGSEFLIPLTLRLHDRAGATFSAENMRLVRSRNRVELSLNEIRTREGAPLDLRNVASMRLEIRSAEKFARDLWLYYFYLTGAAPAAPKPGHALLDFGPQGSALLPGGMPVDETTPYAKWRGYGWTAETRGLTSAQFNKTKPDPMLSDFVWADLGSRTAVLRVDLPDGSYRARFWGGNYTSRAMPQREFALAVNGRTVASQKADPASYYTQAEYFRGMDDWFEANEDTWTKYARDLYHHYDFDFKVKGGKAEFAWSKTLAAFGLLIAPKQDFASSLRGIEQIQRSHFNENLKRPSGRSRDPKPRAADSQRGFLLWSRAWEKDVAPFDLPDDAERDPQTLRVAAAQNQRVHTALSVTPLRPLGELEASVSELKSSTGAALAASSVELRAVKYLWDGWPAALDLRCLFPTARVPSPGEVNVTYWVTATPPRDAVPGVYRGTLRVSTRTGGSSTVPLEIEVLPFRLEGADEHGISYSLWRNSDYNMSYGLRYFLPGKIDYFRKLLRAELANMKAHGLTAFHLTTPGITGVEGDHVVLDFGITREECSALRESGLYGPDRPSLVFVLLEIARNLMQETRAGDFQEPEEISAQLPADERLEEFSDHFNRRFLDAMRQIAEFFDREKIPVMLQLADEPRERNINQWNRNLADAIRYAELVRTAVPDARLYIDSMEDTGAGVSYEPLLRHYDVIATHPWDRSAKLYEGTRTGKPVLRYFNAIVHDRYDYGYEVAASHSAGFSQWHFQWQMQPFQPFHATNRSGVTLPGPDGPVDTPEYESMSAAIDDYRYVATLRSRIAGRTGTAVTQAEAVLHELISNTEPYPSAKEYAEPVRPRTSIAGRSLDQWRTRLADCIQAIDRER